MATGGRFQATKMLFIGFLGRGKTSGSDFLAAILKRVVITFLVVYVDAEIDHESPPMSSLFLEFLWSDLSQADQPTHDI